jgi:hypothetical protein
MIDNDFGVELVNNFHLCSMREKQTDGFYKVENSIEFLLQKNETKIDEK